jgi:hypothetical protein
MSHKCFVRAIGETSYNSNALAFATPEEANSYGNELLSRWFGASDFEVRESSEPVNYIFNYQTGKAESIK